MKNPQRFLRFAADHYALVAGLVHADGLSLDDLVRRVERYRAESDPPPIREVDSLIRLGFLEQRHQSDLYEMPQPVARFFRYLRREHHLTSPEQIRAYVVDITRLDQELQAKCADAERAYREIQLVLGELSDRIETVRNDVAGNREAITDTIIRFRSNREELTLRERYARVIRLWERYIAPMQALIDTEQAMDQCLNALERSLLDAERRLSVTATSLVHEVVTTRLRVIRMRRQVIEDFREALFELEPLYRKALHESETARGVSQILERVRKKGMGALATDQRLRVVQIRQERLFSNFSMQAYLRAVIGYQPDQTYRLDEDLDRGSVLDEHIDWDSVVDALSQAEPDDAMGWLVDALSERGGSLSDLLIAFGRAVRALDLTPGSGPRTYCFRDHRITAHVWQVAAPVEGAHSG